jgi:hypothetical protein
MKKLPPWADGAIFGILFVPLVFFLKITCPIDFGCFVDPFLVPIFSPLFLLQSLFGVGATELSPKTELFFIACFWSLAAALLAHLFMKIFKSADSHGENY